jgi:6-pyruvoyltetrahydropterin/6-carboxytetrahydropterin synthase
MQTMVWVDFNFDAAHRLPNVPATHKCGRMHGHTYRMRVYFTGPVDATLGWVVDYAFIKAAVDQILAQLDHHTLNDVPGLENPTCEIIAAWLAERINLVNLGAARLRQIDLQETERAGVQLCVS